MDGVRRAAGSVGGEGRRRKEGGGEEGGGGGVEGEGAGVAGGGREGVERGARGKGGLQAGGEGRGGWGGRGGLADASVGEHAVAAVQPTVGTPYKCIERFVRVLMAETVEQNLWRAIGLVVAFGIGNEHQIRSRPNPYPAEPNLQTADEVQSLDENLPRLQRTVTVLVFENDDAVPAFTLGGTRGVRVGFGDPPTPARARRWPTPPADAPAARRQLAVP